MPSHALHARWTQAICGASLGWVDELVDSGSLPRKKEKSVEEIVERYAKGIMYGGWVNVEIERGVHDSSRLDCAEFMQLAERVYSETSETGLCNLILHHYLDKIPKILRGLSFKIRWYGVSRTNVIDAIRLLLELEASVLFIIRHWDRITRSSFPEVEIDHIIHETAKHIPFGGLTRETRRRKKNVVLRVLVSCKDVDFRGELLQALKHMEKRVREKISLHLRDIVCDVILDDPRLQQWEGIAKISEVLECGRKY